MAARRPAIRRKSPDRGDSSKNRDNALALKVSLGALLFVGFIFMVIYALGEDKPKKPKNSNPSDNYRTPKLDHGGKDRPRKPGEESTLPEKLAGQFMTALATDDSSIMSKIISWDYLFRRIAGENNWGEKRRYANLDEAGKRKLINDYLFEIMDEEYIEVVQKFFIEDFNKGLIPPNRDVVRGDYGLVGFLVKDDRNRKMIQINLTSELLDGYDELIDAQNPKAWRITRVQHEQFRQLKTGGSKKSRKKDFGAKLGKEKRKRKPRFVGPPEADVTPVPWPIASGEAERKRVNELIVATLDEGNIRKANQSRDEMIQIGKLAIPGVLNAIAALDHSEKTDMKKAWVLIQALREMTNKSFRYTPGNSRQGLGMGGMTKGTPEERTKSLRQWFGWWKVEGATWVKKDIDYNEKSWDELKKDEENEG
ncbi:MAG: hypothetical protein V3W41_05305 [Planctomycetota bacterium]